MILRIYTIIHTLISLVAIFTGLVVVLGMLAGKRLDGWTKWFLITAVFTTVTGFFFPFHGFTPAIRLGIISLPFLALTIFAPCSKQRMALDLRDRRGDLFIFQPFRVGRAVVPENPSPVCYGSNANRNAIQTHTLIVLVLSVVLASIAVVRFHPERTRIV